MEVDGAIQQLPIDGNVAVGCGDGAGCVGEEAGVGFHLEAAEAWVLRHDAQHIAMAVIDGKAAPGMAEAARV